MNKELSLKNCFKLDKINSKWICQVKLPNGKTCDCQLSNNENTSGRRKHIEAKHKDICIEKQEQEPTSAPSEPISSSHNSIDSMLKPYPADSSRSQKLNKAVLNFLIQSNQPLSIVEDPSFVEMLKNFDSRYCPRYILIKGLILLMSSL